MVLLLKLRVSSLAMGVLEPSDIETVNVKCSGLKKLFLIFIVTPYCTCFFVSQEGIAYYNSVLDELENAGVFKRVVVEVIVWWCS